MIRQAVIRTTHGATVARYLPSNYAVTGATPEGWTIIQGEDVAGWTLDGYVLPRLASGLYFGAECQHDLSEPCILD